MCNASAGAWKKLEATGSIPQPRSYHAAAVASGMLYVFGGCGADGRLNELHAYDPAGNQWQQLPASDAVPVGAAGELLHGLASQALVFRPCCDKCTGPDLLQQEAGSR